MLATGYWVLGIGCLTAIEYRVLATEHWVLGIGWWVLGRGCLSVGYWVLGNGRWGPLGGYGKCIHHHTDDAN